MPGGQVDVGAPPAPDPRLRDARPLVRQGRVRAALEVLVGDQVPLPTAGPAGPRERAELGALTIECLLARGDTAAASVRAETLSDLVVGPGAATALQARGEAAGAAGAHETALERYLAAGDAEADDLRRVDPTDVWPTAVWPVPWRVGAALAMVRVGRRAEAAALAQVEHDLAQARGDAHDTAQALRTLATTSADGRAHDRLEEALDLAAAAGSERLGAQVATDLAALAVLGGDPARALALLRDPELYAAREELWPLQSRVRRLLERLGHTPLLLEDELLALLTEAEGRVAVLALDGLRNRQIAACLDVSVKGVEGHLSKIYRKVGVSSRRTLVAAVARRG